MKHLSVKPIESQRVSGFKKFFQRGVEKRAFSFPYIVQGNERLTIQRGKSTIAPRGDTMNDENKEKIYRKAFIRGGVAVPIETYEKLKEYVKENNLTMNTFIIKLLIDFLVTR
jgi:hypothetical protein